MGLSSIKKTKLNCKSFEYTAFFAATKVSSSFPSPNLPEIAFSKEFNADNIRDTFRVILQIGVVLVFSCQMPVIKEQFVITYINRGQDFSLHYGIRAREKHLHQSHQM
ncbi:hypothetical protein L1987_59173 [Smallanthus sonchifolius]|uniref:Uncharacterized protein n=1 Tax=Smallanthus sonchifolius TaxID=185202 RepID=A0ACB9D4J4_9ASTR|nr:hypothetical protein L1987_59173 [Smallanthus sonchifolius]